MLASDSRVDRSASVSSMRRMNVPPWPRASSQLKSAVRALPTCSWPVGLGANRTRMTARHRWLHGRRAQQRDGVRRDRLAAADGVDALVGLALDADAIDRRCRAPRPATRASRRREPRIFGRSRITVTSTLPTSKPRAATSRAAAREQIEARRVLPARIGVRKVPADVAEAGRAENRVGDGVADDVGVGMPERAALGRNRRRRRARAAGRRPADAGRSRCRRVRRRAGRDRAAAPRRDRPPS